MGYGGFPVRRERPAQQNPTDGSHRDGDLCLGRISALKIGLAEGSPENRNRATTTAGAIEQQNDQTKPIPHNWHRSSSLDGSSEGGSGKPKAVPKTGTEKRGRRQRAEQESKLFRNAHCQY